MSIFKRKSKTEAETVKVKLPEEVKQAPYKIITATSVMTDLELNNLYTNLNWELIQVINVNNQNFQHIFKKR